MHVVVVSVCLIAILLLYVLAAFVFILFIIIGCLTMPGTECYQRRPYRSRGQFSPLTSYSRSRRWFRPVLPPMDPGSCPAADQPLAYSLYCDITPPSLAVLLYTAPQPNPTPSSAVVAAPSNREYITFGVAALRRV